MKKLIFVISVLLSCSTAFADGWDTYVEWPGWKISSNEYLYCGTKHTSYPLTHLVDGDPNTAWVFSGDKNAVDAYKYMHPGPYHQSIQIYGNAIADSLWIMNGYNRSKELFNRNNRITEIKLVVNGKVIKTVPLSDKMGWHKISIPKQTVKSIKLVFTGIKKGSDDDTCISEIALYNGAEKVDMHMPDTVVFSPGAECGDDGQYFAMSRSGKKVCIGSPDCPFKRSPSGTLIAFTNESQSATSLVVIDTITGKTICDKKIDTRTKDDWIAFDGLQWKGNDTLVIEICQYGTAKSSSWDDAEIYTRTISVK